MQGIIKVLKEGYGFIKVEGSDNDVFFHANNLEGASFDDLTEGTTLSFEMGEGRNGKEQAVDIQVVEGEVA